MMAAKKLAPDTRPIYNVIMRDAVRIHQAIADGKLPLNCAPIDLNALARWARGAFKDGLTPQALGWAEENGIEVSAK